MFELPDTHLRSQLVDDDDDDQIIENNELELVTKYKKPRTTWSKKRPDDNTNYSYVLPKVNSFFWRCKIFRNLYFIV